MRQCPLAGKCPIGFGTARGAKTRTAAVLGVVFVPSTFIYQELKHGTAPTSFACRLRGKTVSGRCQSDWRGGSHKNALSAALPNPHSPKGPEDVRKQRREDSKGSVIIGASVPPSIAGFCGPSSQQQWPRPRRTRLLWPGCPFTFALCCVPVKTENPMEFPVFFHPGPPIH